MVEEEYIISAVKASDFQDPNKPENVIDNSSSSRWANQGVDSWIQLDLGEEKTPVRSVGIKWFRGNERTYNFVIQTSTDETNPQDVITDGKSTGTTTDLERYDFPADTTARFVRVVVNGNSANNWASIHTSKVFSEPPTIKPAGEVAFDLLSMHNDSKRFKRSVNPTVTENSDGSITIQANTMRCECYSAGKTLTNTTGRIEEFRNKMAELQKRGFWDNPSDFRNNLVIKGKIQIEKIKSGGSFTIELNSIDHEKSDDLKKAGSGYHFTLESSDGRFNHEKEQYHPEYAKKNPEGSNSGSVVGKIVEFEHRIYEDSAKNVVMESYSGNQLIKKTVDKNDWGTKMQDVDPSFRPGEAIHWGSPTVILKANKAKLRFYDLKIIKPT
jgi:hypothetical protein